MRIAATTIHLQCLPEPGDEPIHTLRFCSPTEIPLASLQGRSIFNGMEFRAQFLRHTSEGADEGLSVFGVSIFVDDHAALQFTLQVQLVIVGEAQPS